MYVLIIADENDGGYVYKLSDINPEFVNRLKIIANVIGSRKHKDDNWNTQGSSNSDSPFDLYAKTNLLTMEEIEWLEDLLPDAEYGIHTILNIILITEQEVLL